MADPFSYESDIAPLRGDNFGKAASPTYFAQQKIMEDMMDVNRMASAVKIAEINQAAQRQQLAFETQRLQLEQTKKEIQDKLEAEALYPKVMEQIGGVLNDQTSDTQTKILNLEKIRTSVGPAGITNTPINNIINASVSGIAAKDQYDTARLNVGAQLAASGQTKAAEAALSGLDQRIAKPLISAASYVEAQEKETSKQKLDVEQKKLELEQQEKYRTLNLEALKDSESALRALTPKSLSGKNEDELLEIIAQKRSEATKEGAGAKGIAQAPPLFNPFQQKELQEIMLDLNPTLKPEELNGVPPEELFGSALRLVKRKRRAYIQPQIQTTTTQDLFNR